MISELIKTEQNNHPDYVEIEFRNSLNLVNSLLFGEFLKKYKSKKINSEFKVAPETISIENTDFILLKFKSGNYEIKFLFDLKGELKLITHSITHFSDSLEKGREEQKYSESYNLIEKLQFDQDYIICLHSFFQISDEIFTTQDASIKIPYQKLGVNTQHEFHKFDYLIDTRSIVKFISLSIDQKKTESRVKYLRQNAKKLNIEVVKISDRIFEINLKDLLTYLKENQEKEINKQFLETLIKFKEENK